MNSRRDFIKSSGVLALGMGLASSYSAFATRKVKNVGIQLYTVRKEMLADAIGTLRQLAKLGFTQIESARSEKGNYYGLSPKEIKKVCDDLGLTVRSGHVHIDENWQQSIDSASEAGQEYLICSTMPSRGQTIANYQAVAEAFNKAGEDCKKQNIKFGYHNHDYEFEQDSNQVLYDVLLKDTDPFLVHMELDLGWVIAAGHDPLYYFKNFPGRFPLWHLKDMDLEANHSTEFGKGSLKIKEMLQQGEVSGLKYFFVEQEEYTHTPFESMKENMAYLNKLDY